MKKSQKKSLKLKNKPHASVKIPLAITAVGILIISLMFPYYALQLGVKRCTGAPTDASNCGDADMGGVIFLFAGTPFVVYGLVTLLIVLALGASRPNFTKLRLIQYLYIFLALCLAWFLLPA